MIAARCSLDCGIRRTAMKRTTVSLAALLALVMLVLSPPLLADPGGVGSARLQLVEATVAQLQKALQTGLITSEQLVEMYLARIEAYEGLVNAYIHLDKEGALEQARRLDEARHRGLARSPLYGIPIGLKDIIDTGDMPTTGGSVTLDGKTPPDDAFITKKLRDAGAIILGKLTLTEFANFIAIGMPTGFSSLGRFGFNPYDPRVLPGGDGRPVLQTGGSSSGSGIVVNANLAAIAVGTETSGSILSPANANGVVGIKPTVGLVSRDGIIPITADQDTAGPLARTVADAAVLLGRTRRARSVGSGHGSLSDTWKLLQRLHAFPRQEGVEGRTNRRGYAVPGQSPRSDECGR